LKKNGEVEFLEYKAGRTIEIRLGDLIRFTRDEPFIEYAVSMPPGSLPICPEQEEESIRPLKKRRIMQENHVPIDAFLGFERMKSNLKLNSKHCDDIKKGLLFSGAVMSFQENDSTDLVILDKTYKQYLETLPESSPWVVLTDELKSAFGIENSTSTTTSTMMTNDGSSSPRSNSWKQSIDANTHNDKIAECLLRISEAYSTIPNQYLRTDAFRKAAIRIRNHPEPVMDFNDAIKVRGIGNSCANNIAEFVRTGTMPRLSTLLNDNLAAVIQMKRVWGVGAKKATELVKKGYKTLDDLRKLPDNDLPLSKASAIALKYVEDLYVYTVLSLSVYLSLPHTPNNNHNNNSEKPIPRDEVNEIGEFVKKELKSICPSATAIICGSYRRGESSSGDVDMIVTDMTLEECTMDLLDRLVNRLETTGLITDRLRLNTAHTSKTGHNTFFGICRLKGSGRLFRRIDIKVYPRYELPFALLQWTGNDILNRSMKAYAKRRGLCLSDKYLVPIKWPENMDHPKHGFGNTLCADWVGSKIPCKTEQDVFAFLGLKYIKPEDRVVCKKKSKGGGGLVNVFSSSK